MTGDLAAAADVIERAQTLVTAASRRLAATGGPDAHQVMAYDLAHAAAGVATARGLLDYGAKGDVEAAITCAFVADVAHDLATKVLGREELWGVEPNALDGVAQFLATYRDPQFLAGLAAAPGPRHLDPDFELVQDTFRAFAAKEVAPHAEHVHRHNADVPESVISGLAEVGAFGLSVPAEYGGYSEGGDLGQP